MRLVIQATSVAVMTTLQRSPYQPVTAIAARVARHLDENPPTVDGICGVADALEVPVERFLTGAGA